MAHIIEVKMLVEDTSNSTDDSATDHVKEIISEAFGREGGKEFPRCTLVIMEVKHRDRY